MGETNRLKNVGGAVAKFSEGPNGIKEGGMRGWGDLIPTQRVPSRGKFTVKLQMAHIE